MFTLVLLHYTKLFFLQNTGDMVKEGTFITPTGIFLVSMTILYLITAILHPQEFGMIVYGLMYFICIPSGYLLLTIYSLVNMNNVTWGTRESNKEKEQKKHVGILCNRNCKLCCWDVNVQVTQETENLMFQQIQQAVNMKAHLTKTEIEMITQSSKEDETLSHSDSDSSLTLKVKSTREHVASFEDQDTTSMHR